MRHNTVQCNMLRFGRSCLKDSSDLQWQNISLLFETPGGRDEARMVLLYGSGPGGGEDGLYGNGAPAGVKLNVNNGDEDFFRDVWVRKH